MNKNSNSEMISPHLAVLSGGNNFDCMFAKNINTTITVWNQQT